MDSNSVLGIGLVFRVRVKFIVRIRVRAWSGVTCVPLHCAVTPVGVSGTDTNKVSDSRKSLKKI